MSYTSNASHLIIKYKNLFNILCGATVQKTPSIDWFEFVWYPTLA